MKKIVSSILAIIMILSVSCPASAVDLEATSFFIEEDGYEYEYIQYSEPVSYTYDGTTHTLLGIIQKTPKDSAMVTRDYYEYTTWSITDCGIAQSWVNMSNPYFVRSVARGEIIEESFKRDIEIAVKAGINIPGGLQSRINELLKADFTLESNSRYTKEIIITLSGPTEPSYNTRTFYYKLGYHKHIFEIVERVYSNWDGLISETVHQNCYGYEPAVQSYSVDSNA